MTATWTVAGAALTGLALVTVLSIKVAAENTSTRFLAAMSGGAEARAEALFSLTSLDGLALAEGSFTQSEPERWQFSGQAGLWNPRGSSFADDTGQGDNTLIFIDNGGATTIRTTASYDPALQYQLQFRAGDSDSSAGGAYSAQLLAGSTVIGQVNANSGDTDGTHAVELLADTDRSELSGQPISIAFRARGGDQVAIGAVSLMVN